MEIKHHDLGAVIHPFDPKLVGSWEQWSEYYVGFHKDRPWNEYLWCSNCAVGADQYGPKGTIGFREAVDKNLTEHDSCPVCGTQLELFWSPRRIRGYVEQASKMPGFNGAVVTLTDQIICWYWGYLKTPNELSDQLGKETVFYVDAIASNPKARGNFLYESSIYFLHWIGNTVEATGATKVVLRTHRKALNVTMLSKVVGFQPTTVASVDDKERFFWARGTTDEDQVEAFTQVDSSPRFSKSLRRH